MQNEYKLRSAYVTVGRECQISSTLLFLITPYTCHMRRFSVVDVLNDVELMSGDCAGHVIVAMLSSFQDSVNHDLWHGALSS